MIKSNLPAKLLQISRPVLFEQENEEYPYWGKGSSFFVSMGEQCFLVSAKHVFTNQKASPNNIRVYPDDLARQSVPFNERVNIPDDGSDDEVFKDLYILRMDMTSFQETGDAPLHTVALKTGCTDPLLIVPGDPLLAIGFPSERRLVDFDNCKISYDRFPLPGSFSGQSTFMHCHEMTFDPSAAPSDLDGMSGGPVFHTPKGGAPRLAGVLIQGVASRGKATFISVIVLRTAILLALK